MAREDRQTLYVITADTYERPYGSIITLLMVTDDLAEAERHRTFMYETHGLNTTLTEVKNGAGTMAHLGGHIE